MMLARLNDQILDCHEHATLARFRAITAKDPVTQKDYWRLEQSWLKLADSLEFAERVSGFLQWNAQRLQPPPP